MTKELAIIRSMTSKEGNHGRATYLLHTGYAPSGGIVHPGFGSIVANELGPADFDLPHFVSIQGESIGPSFLGVQYAPFVVTDPNRPPDNLASPVNGDRLERRLGLLKELEDPFARSGAADQVRDHEALYNQTAHMVLSPRVKAFDLAAEPEKVRTEYGRTAFGQGCLMARRLIEAGVTFVEVQSTGWDTHGNELSSLKKLIPPVDQGTAALLADLKQRGLLEKTLGDLDGRIRPHAADQPDGRPRSFSEGVQPGPGRLRRAGRASHRRYGQAWHRSGRSAGAGGGSVLHLLPGAGHRSAAREPEQRRPADQDRRGWASGEGSVRLRIGRAGAGS